MFKARLSVTSTKCLWIRITDDQVLKFYHIVNSETLDAIVLDKYYFLICILLISFRIVGYGENIAIWKKSTKAFN